MPTTYTGVGSNVTASSSPTISEPADGDGDSASAFTPAFQRLCDYVANIFGSRVAAPVTITPTAGWAARSGLAYWKDSNGFVNVKGSVGPGGSNPVFTFPAGFRPSGGNRCFIGCAGNAGTVTVDQSVFRVYVAPDGTVTLASVLGPGLPTTNVTDYFLDVVRFLAEQ